MVPDPRQHLTEVFDTLSATGGTDETDLALLRLFHEGARLFARGETEVLARLQRRGTFAEHGYKNTSSALGDMLGLERFESRQLVNVAENVYPQIGLDGSVQPPKLSATAKVFTAGQTSVRHVDVITRVLGSSAANRITAEQWDGVEAELADKATVYTPTELRAHGKALVDMLDQDGPKPDDKPDKDTNEVFLFPSADGAGGTIKGHFTDSEMFEAVATAVAAQSGKKDPDDHRSLGARQAEALADICGYALAHDETIPTSGGFRPTITAIISFEDLRRWAKNSTTPYAGGVTPESLRMWACDASIVPVVMNGEGQPLDVGRRKRTIPKGMRAAVAARDQGCSWPGCTATVSWSECHHIVPWELGGHTKIDNLVMVCVHHHRVIHETDWIVRIRDGLPEFVPPRWIDPDQVPRRKPHPHLYEFPRAG